MRVLTFRIYILLILCFQLSNSYSQGRVTGHVLDENRQPLPGVNVIVKGTASGTTTDAMGAFSVPALPTATLVFSFIGYHTVEMEVKNRDYIEIKLNTDTRSTRFASLHVPSLSDLFVNDFAQLETSTTRITAAIEVKFADHTSKVGEGVLIGYNESHLFFMSVVDLFYSNYSAPLKEILIGFQGQKNIQGLLFLLPDTVESMNPDLAVISVDAELFPVKTELLFSNTHMRTYFINSGDGLLRLSLTRTNTSYEELYFRANKHSPVSLGTPVYDKYGVAGLIVDNMGQTLIATETSRSLSMLLEDLHLLGDTTQTLFNSHKHGKKFNFKKLRPIGLHLGWTISSNFFNGADLSIRNSVFTPSFSAFVATHFLGFELGYEISHNNVESKAMNAPATYIRLRNTHYGHSLVLDKSIFNVGGFTFLLSGALSHFEFSAVLFNSLEQEVSLETALAQDIGATFKSFALGLKIESPKFIGHRHKLILKILVVNTNTSYLDVNINNLANSSRNDDMLLKAQFGYSFRLF